MPKFDYQSFKTVINICVTELLSKTNNNNNNNAQMPDIHIALHSLQPWQASFLCGDSAYFRDSLRYYYNSSLLILPII